MVHCTLLYGEEYVLAQETLQNMRVSYAERSVSIVDSGSFAWPAWWDDVLTPSLFGGGRLLELHLSHNKPNVATQNQLSRLIEEREHLQDDVVVYLPIKLDRSQQQSAWFKQWQNCAKVIALTPLQGDAYVQWLRRMFQERRLQYTDPLLLDMAMMFESHALAARQSIDLLALLHPDEIINLEHIKAISQHAARYEVFRLAEAWQMRDLDRTQTILAFWFKEEGPSCLPLMVWSTVKVLRVLMKLKEEEKQGMLDWSSASQRYQLWGQQLNCARHALSWLTMPGMIRGLMHCARIDRLSKGGERGEDPWLAWHDVLMQLMGVAGRS